jgi:hypothetical protein
MPIGSTVPGSSIAGRRPPLVMALLLVLLAAPLPVFASRADLARALALYNQRRFDQAIEAALVARRSAETRDAAAIVLARALLERYRQHVDPADLSAAREALGAVRVEVLSSRERLEYLLALGEALFLEDDFGAAAALLSSGVAAGRAEDPALAEALIDWWGSAVEREADLLAPEARRRVFARFAERMGDELARTPESASAAYWRAAALRGAGDAVGAWHSATAGWVRARLAGERAAGLRADLDKLVLQGIIPDRVRPLAPADRIVAASQLRAEWELLKERWR